MATEFKLPELGENIDTASVIKVLVKPGDTIQKDQPVLELETDKATIEVPSSISGVVKEIRVQEGGKAEVGQVVLTVDDASGQSEPKQKAGAPALEKAKPAQKRVEEKAEKKTATKTKPQPKAAKAAPKPAGGVEEFKIPELGENIEEATVIKVLVKPGDRVSKDQPLVELETDKAAVEVPSSADGTIKEVRIKEGDKAKVGQIVFVIDRGGSAEQAPVEEVPVEDAKEEQEVEEAVEEVRGEPQDQPAVAAESVAPAVPVVEEKYRPADKVAPASPSVRRFAREIGIDINTVLGTGPRGRISIEDVKKFS
ncbi:MAG TPA: biotin/lipoyl-containing protein, partial [Acidobacteriota bacterium]|nr:biotin/lipoyl-containing protein [Acidobacteriota bacterium]